MAGRLSRGLVLGALALLLAAPAAQGHPAPEPLENEVHVLADEHIEAYEAYSGYDIRDVHIREADLPQLVWDAGIVVRMTLAGGYTPPEQDASDRPTHHVILEAETPEGTFEKALVTKRYGEWGTSSLSSHWVAFNSSDGEVPDGSELVDMQVLVEYTDLGAGPGDTIRNISVRTIEDEAVRDIAPGGFHAGVAPSEPVGAEEPTLEDPEEESRRLAEVLPLDGTAGYLDTRVITEGVNVTVALENPLSVGQHVTLDPRYAWGWDIDPFVQDIETEIPRDGATEFSFKAVRSDRFADREEPLPVVLTTDLGGREVFYLGWSNDSLEHGWERSTVTVDVTDRAPGSKADKPGSPVDVPGPGLAAGLAVLAGLAALGRSRQSP